MTRRRSTTTVLNYGRGTPIATLLAHIAYGAMVGGFLSIAR